MSAKNSIQDLTGGGSVTLSAAVQSLTMSKSGAGHMGDHGDSGQRADMQGLRDLYPDPRDSGVVYALNGGSWFDPDTWSTGRVPRDGDEVYIPMGVSVVYDGVSDARLDTVAVDGGLHFAVNTDTRLVVDTMATGAMSTLTIGEEGNPVQKNVTAEIIIHRDNGPIDLSDTSQLEKGVITHGKVRIAGQDKADFLYAGVDPAAGDSSLVFKSAPTGWEVGDKLVVAGTKLVGRNKFEDEVVTIKDITKLANGTYVVDLDQTLRHDHVPPENSAGVDFAVPVANYTRNVLFATETDGDQYLSDGKTVPITERGHVMFMHNADVSVENAEFFELGRTDKSQVLDSSGDNVAGRYALHFHRTGTEGEAALAEGNAVWGSPGWGIVHHDANLDVISNAVYGVNGGAIIAEAGNEVGIWHKNITINTTGEYLTFNSEDNGNPNHPLGRQQFLDDSFHQGIGYGFKSRLIETTDNVAVSSNGAGYSFMPMGIEGGSPSHIDPETEAFMDLHGYNPFLKDGTVAISEVPSRSFSGNEAIVAHVGFNTSADKRPTKTDVVSVIEDFTAWEVTEGFGGFYQGKYVLKDSILVGVDGGMTHLLQNTPAGSNSVGVMSREFHAISVVNNHIENFDYGVWESSHNLRSDGIYIILGNNFVDVKTDTLLGKDDYVASRYLVNDNSQDWRSSAEIGQLAASVNLAQSQLKMDETYSKVKIVVDKIDALGPTSVSLDMGMNSWEGIVQRNGYYSENGSFYMVLDVAASDRAVGSVGVMQVAVELAFAGSDPGVFKGATNLGPLPSSLDANGIGSFEIVDVRELGKSGNQLLATDPGSPNQTVPDVTPDAGTPGQTDPDVTPNPGSPDQTDPGGTPGDGPPHQTDPGGTPGSGGQSTAVLDLRGPITVDGQYNAVMNIAHKAEFALAAAQIDFSFKTNDAEATQGLIAKDADGFEGGGHHFKSWLQDGMLFVRYQNGVDEVRFGIGGVEADREYDVKTTFGSDGVAAWLDGKLIGADSDFLTSWETNVEYLQIGGDGAWSGTGENRFKYMLDGTISDVSIVDQSGGTSGLADTAGTMARGTNTVLSGRDLMESSANFYAEDTDTIVLDLDRLTQDPDWTAGAELFAVDTKKPYEEINLGTVQLIEQTIDLGYTSDWEFFLG